MAARRSSGRKAARTRRAVSRAATPRARRSARGRGEFGLGIASTWRRANYAYPGGVGRDRGKRPSYPIDPRHVVAARQRAAQRGTAGTRAGVDRALRRRYGSVPRALAAARRARGR
jgi:hypothetical protein